MVDSSRIAHQVSGGVDQAVVHAPGVDAEADDVVVFPGGPAKSLLHLLEERGEVPVKVAADAYLTVGEAVQFVEHQPATVVAPGNHATASGAEVYRDERAHDFLPKMYVSKSSISAGVSTS